MIRDGTTVLENFNPRSRKGSDLLYPAIMPAVRRFQSTLPQGERLAASCWLINPIRFQSTLPQGERPLEGR